MMSCVFAVRNENTVRCHYNMVNFFPNLFTKDTQDSPVRERYGVRFVNSMFDLSVSVFPVLYRIWWHWTSKTLVRYILSSVCLRLNQFSQLSFMQCMGLSLPISFMMIVRICILHLTIIVTSEVWPICHCLGLGHETMVSALCLSILLWYIGLRYNGTSLYGTGNIHEVHKSQNSNIHNHYYRWLKKLMNLFQANSIMYKDARLKGWSFTMNVHWNH